MQFVTLQLFEGETISLSEAQTLFLGWCNQHYKQLQIIRDSGALDRPATSFTTHLKPCVPPQVPEVDTIDLHWNYKPRSLSTDTQI